MSKHNKPALPTFNPFKVKGYDPKPVERNYFFNIAKILDLKATQKAYLKDKIPFPMTLVNQMRDLYRDCRYIETRLGWRWEGSY